MAFICMLQAFPLCCLACFSVFCKIVQCSASAKMILYNAFDGAAQDSAYLHVFCGCCLTNLFGELLCDASYAVYRHFPVLINGNVTLEEQAESADQHVMDGRMCAMLCDEWHKRGKERVGGRLAIDVLDDVGQRHVVFVAERLFKLLG